MPQAQKLEPKHTCNHPDDRMEWLDSTTLICTKCGKLFLGINVPYDPVIGREDKHNEES